MTSIGDDAFAECYGLTSVTIGNSVTSIGDDAFAECYGLTSVTIGNSVTSIGDGAFYGCGGLTGIVVNSGNTKYDSRDNCNAIIKTATNELVAGCKNTTIPNSVTSIGESAFNGCSLAGIKIPDSVTSIGKNAFYNCDELIRIEIPNSITSIGDGAFYGCDELIRIEIPNSVTSIGKSMFSNCTGLRSVKIGSSVKSIGEYAFNGCDDLERIHLSGKTPPTVGSNCFTNKNYLGTQVYVPKGTLATYQAADVWKEFWEIIEYEVTAIDDVMDDAPAFEITAGGILFTAADGKTIAIYTTSGALVEKIDCYNGEEITLYKGVYIVRVGNKTMKIRL